MTAKSTSRVLGVANYEARWIAKSLLVRLTATGVLPCINYEAQLEKRPERVSPPMWDMVFIVDDYCLKALKPFSVEAIMTSRSSATSITVRDAVGEHQISILQPREKSSEPSLLVSASDLDEYLVYAKLPKLDGAHHGCIVVPADTFVTGIHYRAFGPASKADCQAFVSKNCTAESPNLSKLNLPGGEIPWPFVVDD